MSNIFGDRIIFIISSHALIPNKVDDLVSVLYTE